MSSSNRFLSPAETAGRLGVSVKALRVYEDRGLVCPTRTAAGWRTYGPEQLTLAAEVVGLRTLGFSLAQIEGVLGGAPDGLEAALAAHQSRVEIDLARIRGRLDRIRSLRRSLAAGEPLKPDDLAELAPAKGRPVASFELPWPWGGERFELSQVGQINYIVGPLGSGKTRLAVLIAEHLPNARFLGLDRLERLAEIRQRLEKDATAQAEVEAALAWLIEDGASGSEALFALVASVCLDRLKVLVIDLIEQGLDEPTQYAVMAHLRRRSSDSNPLFVLTRSSAILDLPALGPDETVTFCPANHSPPFRVGCEPVARGFEAVETCLGSPAARARTEGMIAHMPRTAA